MGCEIVPLSLVHQYFNGHLGLVASHPFRRTSLLYSVLSMWLYYVEGSETASGQAPPLATCRFYLPASAVSLVYKFVTTPRPWRRRCLHITLSDHHAALSARPQAVSSGDCAPWTGIPSSRGLASVSSRPDFYPRDWPISSTSTRPGADDVVDSLVQRPGRAFPALAKVPGSTSLPPSPSP